MQFRFNHIALAVTLTLLPASAAFACATCGCALSSDAAAGYSAQTGWSIGLQYDYVPQTQLRSGSKAVSVANVAALNDNGGSQEVEKSTYNRYFTANIGYAPSAEWNFKLQVPFANRSHETYVQSGNPLTAENISAASFKQLGDIKLMGSYQGFLPTHNLGVQLGVKLPTGRYGGPNADATGTVGRKPVAFKSGPASQADSPGNLLDASLQPGNGSTDLILGAYYYQAVSQDFDAFVNGQFQSSILHRLKDAGADFRPGNSVNISAGMRYVANSRIVPQLQLNATHKSSDQGALADTANTAGTAVYLSPGVSARIGQNASVFAFVQLPIFSRLQGTQLFPRWTASVGVNYAF